jgi:hypothetical protein
VFAVGGHFLGPGGCEGLSLSPLFSAVWLCGCRERVRRPHGFSLLFPDALDFHVPEQSRRAVFPGERRGHSGRIPRPKPVRGTSWSYAQAMDEMSRYSTPMA